MFDGIELNWKSCGCLVVLALIVLAIFAVPQYASVEYVTGTILDTPVEQGNTAFNVLKDNGDKEIFVNNDEVWFLKFNSRDYLMNLQKGHRYEFKVNWFRVGLFSWSRNIVGYKELPSLTVTPDVKPNLTPTVRPQ